MPVDSPTRLYSGEPKRTGHENVPVTRSTPIQAFALPQTPDPLVLQFQSRLERLGNTVDAEIR